MKPTTSLLGLTLLASVLYSPAYPETDAPFGNNTKPSAKKPNKPAANDNPFETQLIRTQIEHIEVSLTTLASLLNGPQASHSDTALRQRLQELLQGDSAKLTHISLITSRDGEKTSNTSHREFIYPTEYEPPELPNTIHIHQKDGTVTNPAITNIATGPTPTAFETDNIGTHHEILASLSDSKTQIDLQLHIGKTKHIENFIWNTWKDSKGRADIQMPVFYKNSVVTSLTLTSGQPTLVATLTPDDDKGKSDYSRKILVFAKSTIITVK